MTCFLEHNIVVVVYLVLAGAVPKPFSAGRALIVLLYAVGGAARIFEADVLERMSVTLRHIIGARGHIAHGIAAVGKIGVDLEGIAAVAAALHVAAEVIHHIEYGHRRDERAILVESYVIGVDLAVGRSRPSRRGSAPCQKPCLCAARGADCRHGAADEQHDRDQDRSGFFHNSFHFVLSVLYGANKASAPVS